MRLFLELSAAALVTLALSTGVAHAQQRAPITYAGQAQAEQRLAGGAEESYGYGAGTQRTGAVIDIRRPGAAREQTPAQVEQQAPAPAPVAGRAGEQPWLERERVGPPYEAGGRWYVPTPEPGYEQVGEASWYGPTFHGQPTASGEIYDQEAMTAAHPTLPLHSLVQVTNLENGREVIVRITDRGPFVGERLIDLSRAAAEVLGFEQAGRARVHVRYLGPAPRRVNADGQSPAPVLAQPAAPIEAPAPPERVDGPMSLWPEDVPAPTGAPVLQQTGYTAAPGGAYVVQVGAFSDPANAQRARALAEAAGAVEVDVRRTAAGGELFRVRVGPWATREEAEAARRTLAGLGFPDASVAAR